MGCEAAKINVSDVLRRVQEKLSAASNGEDETRGCDGESVLLATAARYSSPPSEFSVTPPTGFDPDAAALFEAIVESAFLIANADGEFDAAEREVFALVVLEASEHRVSARQVQAIVSDLTTQLAEDGLDQRLERLRSAISKPQDRREVLRIAALLARASAGISSSERAVLGRLASLWELPPGAVDEALTAFAGVLDG
ncbi:MAG: tellurite resistance TerB family protein [Myxococcales bacterium]